MPPSLQPAPHGLPVILQELSQLPPDLATGELPFHIEPVPLRGFQIWPAPSSRQDILAVVGG